VSTTPNPTNGTFGVQGGSGGAFYQRIDANASDPSSSGVNSNIVAAEYFIDTIGPNGTGGAMLPVSGKFDSPTEAIYALADLYGIHALPQGVHTIYVHAKDAAGNWGDASASSTTFLLDKTGPDITGASLAPNPNNAATTVNLTATATDPANNGSPANGPATNVVAAEYFIGSDPGQGHATAITVASPATSVGLAASINVASLPIGVYTVSVRAQDAAHNWGPVTKLTLTINQH